MKKAIIILSILTTAGAISCTYDKEEELSGTCSTAGVSYSTTITGILNNKGCVFCHSAGSPSGGVNLQGHAAVKVMADNGRLFGSISHAPGFAPMPQGAPKLSDCDIRKVKAWIDAGAPNN